MTLKLRSNSKNYTHFIKKIISCRNWVLKQAKSLTQLIIENIIKHKDKAIIAYNYKFDKIKTNKLKVPVKLPKTIDLPSLFNIKMAYDRIRAHHQLQIPKNVFIKDKAGIITGYKWQSVNRVAVYVPAGSASYISTVLMNAIPAKIAQVKQIYLVTPYYKHAKKTPILLCSKLCGIKTIYQMGGAQAIAAISFGTNIIKKMDMITGPGNMFVTAAKQACYGNVGIDLIAGPSEIMILTDAHNNLWNIVVDMLSQLEHDKRAQAIVLSNFKSVCSKLRAALKLITNKINKTTTLSSWNVHGITITCATHTQMKNTVNIIAPEHLQIQTKMPLKIIKHIKNAGAMFLGKYSPVVIGDYLSGTNHVLPTFTTARFSSGLSVTDFLKRVYFTWVTKKHSFKKVSKTCINNAIRENLKAHALSVKQRTLQA